MNEYTVVMVFVSSILTLQLKIKIMKVLKYNQSGRIVFLVIKWNQIVFKSKDKKKCYEYVFNSM